MKYTKSALSALALVLILTAAAPLASAQADHVRWDIASVPCSGPGGSYPCTFNPGGTAVASAMDCALTSAGFFGNVGCSTITLTGSGTFVVPARSPASPSNQCGREPLVSQGDRGIEKDRRTGATVPLPTRPAN